MLLYLEFLARALLREREPVLLQVLQVRERKGDALLITHTCVFASPSLSFSFQRCNTKNFSADFLEQMAKLCLNQRCRNEPGTHIHKHTHT